MHFANSLLNNTFIYLWIFCRGAGRGVTGAVTLWIFLNKVTVVIMYVIGHCGSQEQLIWYFNTRF